MSRRLASAVFLAAALLIPAAAFAQNTPPDSTNLVFWHIEPARPCPGDTVRLAVEWCDDCIELNRASNEPGTGLVIEVTRRPVRIVCDPDTCRLGKRYVRLGVFQAGYYTFAGKLITH